MRLEPTVYTAADLVRGVKPEQWHDPTPCTEWDVRTLTNHLLQVATALDLAGRGEPVPAELWSRDLIDGPNPFESWTDPGELTATVTFGDDTMPGPMVQAMLASDLVLHGWDLAEATGQEFTCTPDAAATTLAFIEQTADQGRAAGLYAQPVPVAEETPILDRALALSGRDPAWRT